MACHDGLWIGTSGWEYADWSGRLYPSGMSRSRWLGHYARVFDTVEINSTFYQLPRTEATVARWREATRPRFRFAVKVSRYLTHVRRLVGPEEPVQRFLHRMRPLGSRMGPVLVQLPPTMEAAVDRLDQTLACFPSGMEIAVEPRHPSWWGDDVRRVLERHRVALVWPDRGGACRSPMWRTAGWVYVRLHGDSTPTSGYRSQILDCWAERLAGCRGYVYFNNDRMGSAVEDALALRRRLGQGVRVVPPP